MTGRWLRMATSSSAADPDVAGRVDPGLAIGALGLADRPVGDGDELDAGRAADDPRREAAAGIPGSDQADADRVASGGARFERAKDGAHACVSVVEIRPGRVLVGHDHAVGDGPVDVQRRVVPADAALGRPARMGATPGS